MKNTISRRTLVKSSVFGILTAAIPNVTYASAMFSMENESELDLPSRYPSIDDDIVKEVVGKSHFDLETVKNLVDKRTELARATWDWSFGDWESAIGAASHVGRRDIVFYLISKGARPTMFTYAMLGAYDIVKNMIDLSPGIQKTMGPHGISLASHAKFGLRMKDEMTSDQIANCEKLIDFLDNLEGAAGETYLEMTDTKEKYLGDYKYGNGSNDGFSIKENSRKMLSLGKLGEFGGGLYKTGNNEFMYNGVPSVRITFQIENEIVKSLTVVEPELTLVAKKVS